MISFLMTTERSTLSKIESVFFGRYWVNQWRSQKFAETWGPENHPIDRIGTSKLVTSLLTSYLSGLGEVAIWAPTEDGDRRWEFDYPFELIKDLCELCKKQKLYQVQIVFTRVGDVSASREYGFLDTIQECFATEDEPVEFKLMKDKEEIQEVERHWGISGIKAVLTMEFLGFEVAFEDTRGKNLTTVD
jgi:hypothetical protein